MAKSQYKPRSPRFLYDEATKTFTDLKPISPRKFSPAKSGVKREVPDGADDAIDRDLAALDDWED